MARWEPGAKERLAQAAMELYVERGFEQTTVAEIAQRAGLTERTFFRHFADKREVLFGGAAGLQAALVDAVAAAPAGTTPMDAVTGALMAWGKEMGDRRDFALKRQAVVAANTELQERELIKMATLSSAIAGALRDRGVGEPAASLTAQAGIAVFRVAFERWVDGGAKDDLDRLVAESLGELRAVTALS
jgi:AcrR family transcriptional regulator